MDLIVVMILSFSALILSIYKGLFIGYPLILCFFMFAILALRRDFTIKDILNMSYIGGKKVFVVLRIFALIGIITAVWISAGTVPGIVYYGIRLMNPNFFVVYAFLISSVVSFLLGTAFGTVSTVGVALMVIARAGDININLAAGALIAGAYFGDRTSPMSSSANLVAYLTATDLYTNIRNMFKTAVLPFTLSIILYTIISIYNPLNLMESSIDHEIIKIFTINWIVLIPAIIILFFAAFKIDVKISMVFSILSAFIISISLQNYSFTDVFNYTLWGFHLDINSPLQEILKGGGIFSMGRAAVIVFISSALSGILEGTEMLKALENVLLKMKSRSKLFISTTTTAIITSMLGCNQTISIVLTTHIMKKAYKEKGIAKEQLALDIENTSVVIAPLIPWNIASLLPTTTLMVGVAGFIPYAFYLYLIPIINVLYLKSLENRKKTITEIIA
ncbi:MAG: Na+/H+ antiporter NhaC family protein [Clostridiaceae bacterium]|nr:Na+/H+ antiporter NhaC family protein [Clostridiaceae bacterium]